MRRVWFAVLGAAFAAVGGWFLAAFWSVTATEPASVAAVASWFAASALYVLGGLGASPGEFEWYQLVGLGHVCLGLQQVVRVPVALADGSATGVPLAATLAMGAGGLALAYIGVDWIRGGRHFDLSEFGESGVNPE